MKPVLSAVTPTRADNRAAFVRLAILTVISGLAFAIVGCGDPEPPPPTLNPAPPLSQSEAIEIAKASLTEVIEDIEFAGYDQIRVRVGNMRLSYLQELTNSDLYSPDSPRMQRQIWAIQIGGTFPNDPDPYRVDYGYGIVGIDAINGDIHLRARYDQEILVEP